MVVMTRGASGVVGVIHHAWTSAQQPSPPWVVVSGTRGRLTFELGASWLRLAQAVPNRPGSVRRRQWADPDGPGVPGEHPDGSEPEMSGTRVSAIWQWS